MYLFWYSTKSDSIEIDVYTEAEKRKDIVK